MCPAHAIRDTSIIARSIPDFSRGRKERKRGRGTSFLELGLRKAVIPGASAETERGWTENASRRVGVPRIRLLHPLERSGATVVERVTSGRVQCLAMTPVRSTVQGKGEWPSPLAPLIRSCRAATRFTFASRRHCGSPSPEGGTANTFLGTCTPTPYTLPHTSRRPCLFDWSPLFLLSMDESRVFHVASLFFSSIEIFPSTLDLWNPQSISIFSRRRRLSSRCFN